jgi:hypothetical protein
LTNNNYIHTTQSYSNVEFAETFNKYFPRSDIPKPIHAPLLETNVPQRERLTRTIRKGGGEQDGGLYYPNRIKSPYPYNIVKDESDICYTIKIDLMLRKGSSITDQELNTLLCNARWNEITKPISTILNTAHSIRPDINLAIVNKTVNNRGAKSTHNKTRKTR